MNMFFTADWHIGEQSAPNTHSFLRPEPTAAMVARWMEQCRRLIKPGRHSFSWGTSVSRSRTSRRIRNFLLAAEH